MRENHESPAIAERASDIHSATALGQALSYNVFHSATLAVRTVPTAQVRTHGVTCPRPHTENVKTKPGHESRLDSKSQVPPSSPTEMVRDGFLGEVT